MPPSLEPLYTLNMLLAAVGYFLFTYFVFFRLDPERTRIVLAITGIASVGLFVAIASVRPHEAPGARRLALLGCAAFCLQTAVLDALVWPFYFPF